MSKKSKKQLYKPIEGKEKEIWVKESARDIEHWMIDNNPKFNELWNSWDNVRKNKFRESAEEVLRTAVLPPMKPC